MHKNPSSPKPGQTATQPKSGASAAAPGAAPAAAGHSWKGEAVEDRDVAGRSESPEESARRAEGNAPVAAERASEGSTAPGTFDWKHPPHPDAALDDEAARRENEEEKRQSAAEEHAADSPKHAPHGRL